MSRFVVIAVVAPLLACSTPKEGVLVEPAHHRVAPASCPPAPPGNPYPPSVQRQPCFADSDCKDGADGRCRGSISPQGSGGASFDNTCVYDQCVDDTGCPSTSLCDCRNAAQEQANICMAAACKRDSDCGSPGFCSASARLWVPTYGHGQSNARPAGVEYGYFCHTPLDECSNDVDCSNADGGSTDTTHCAFDSKAGHWRCARWVGSPD